MLEFKPMILAITELRQNYDNNKLSLFEIFGLYDSNKKNIYKLYYKLITIL